MSVVEDLYAIVISRSETISRHIITVLNPWIYFPTLHRLPDSVQRCTLPPAMSYFSKFDVLSTGSSAVRALIGLGIGWKK